MINDRSSETLCLIDTVLNATWFGSDSKETPFQTSEYGTLNTLTREI